MIIPDLPYESYLKNNKKVCLLCGGKSFSTLYLKNNPLIPLCKNCSTDWNCYGYRILKKISFSKVAKNFIFKPIEAIKITPCFIRFMIWSKKMKKIKNRMKHE